MNFTGWLRFGFPCAVLLVLGIPWSGKAEGQESNASDVAKELSNPVSDMVSIPAQFNWENGVGPDSVSDLRFVLNVQPVIPFSLNEKWNLIGRFIVPYINQPAGLLPGSLPTSGTGDIVMSTFLSPKESAITWGVGPVFGIPTTTNPLLGSGKWQAGPTFVVLKLTEKYALGGLANHLWSFANTGKAERDKVNTTFLQPFVALFLPKAMTLTLQSESTCNWEANDGERWTVPINVLLSKVTKLGPFPFSVLGGAGYYVETPTGGPDWKLRTAFTLILPAGK